MKEELEISYGDKKVMIAPDFKLEQCISVNRDNDAYRELEIEREIPHRNLRDVIQRWYRLEAENLYGTNLG